MRKGIKYALFFTGGVAVGIGVCGANLISYALSDEDIREALKNKIYRKVDKTLYGERSRRNYGTRVSYRSYYEERNRRDNKINYQFNNNKIIFDSRTSAEEVKEKMEEIIDEYGHVAVSDLYEIAAIKNDYWDSKYGWTSLRNAKVIRCRDGYYIDLPKPLPIDWEA